MRKPTGDSAPPKREVSADLSPDAEVFESLTCPTESADSVAPRGQAAKLRRVEVGIRTGDGVRDEFADEAPRDVPCPNGTAELAIQRYR